MAEFLPQLVLVDAVRSLPGHESRNGTDLIQEIWQKREKHPHRGRGEDFDKRARPSSARSVRRFLMWAGSWTPALPNRLPLLSPFRFAKALLRQRQTE